MWYNKDPAGCRKDPMCQLRPVRAKKKKQEVVSYLPKDVHVLMSQTWRSYLPRQNSSRCGYIRALKMGESILDYIGECCVILGFLRRWKREAEGQSQREFWSSCSADLENGGRGHEPRNVAIPLWSLLLSVLTFCTPPLFQGHNLLWVLA